MEWWRVCKVVRAVCGCWMVLRFQVWSSCWYWWWVRVAGVCMSCGGVSRLVSMCKHFSMLCLLGGVCTPMSPLTMEGLGIV